MAARKTSACCDAEIETKVDKSDGERLRLCTWCGGHASGRPL